MALGAKLIKRSWYYEMVILPPSREQTQESPKSDHPPFSITTRTETEIRPYVGVSAVFLYWYLKIVSVAITNNSDASHSLIHVRLNGMSGISECGAIQETFVIPFLGPHDSDTRVFHYKHKMDCPYDLTGEIVSYQ
jgi:hypothetical protein